MNFSKGQKMTDTQLPIHLKHPHKITLYKNGNKPNIYYYFTYNKKKYMGSTSTPDIQESIDKAIEIFYEISHGIKQEGKVVKFENVVKKFFEYKEKQELSEKTLTEYKRQSKYLIERFKGKDIEEFTSKKIYLDYQEWRRNYYETHPNKRFQKYKRGERKKKITGREFTEVGNYTINRELRLLVSILKFGKEYMNVLMNTEIPPYTMLPEKRRNEILTKDEYLALENYWMNKNSYYWLIISFVNNTGVRYPSELNNIKWKDVNFDKNSILIRNRKNRKKSQPINTPIPMIGTSREIIETLYKRNQEKGISMNPEDYVFVNDNGIQIKDIRKSFKKSLKECGIDKDLTMYSLRHLYTTRMVKRPDIPLKMISYTLGHKDTTMIERVYSHLRSEDVVKTFENSESKKQEILNKEKKKIENEIDDKSKKLQEIKKQLDELISNE